ncbi:acetyl-CoA synthetase-like protein [Penicillium paradoxum]|uniref:acetyl-CoA synthetase-like protein n=1 Tax=Penicillium paradoxum TaxID=176176 RepID=UPI0025496F19|nr:acetyl-CoA synthetase-like protein [Penicillium paradoxum]KAJ5780603.1 acetyl-CoA synthetase-like protein [Penicillium paradoxum]
MMQLSESDGPPLLDTTLTINGLFRQTVLHFSDTVALVCTHQPRDLYGVPSLPLCDDGQEAPYLRWTYRDLDRAIQRFANGLRRRGLRKGDPVLMFMTNTAEYVIATWAAYRIGCVHVPINPRSLSHTREVQHMLRTTMKGCNTKSIATIAGNADLCPQIEKLTAGVPCMKILVDGLVDGWIPFEDLMEEPTIAGKDGQCDGNDPEPGPGLLGSSIFFTSGTTSLPKGCFVQTSSYPFTVATSWRQSWQPMLPGDRVALALPNNHAFSYMCLMSSFVNAATIVFPGSGFVPETVIRVLHQEQCSHTAFVPTMILALSGVSLAPGQKLNSLRRVLLAGAPPTEEVIRICLDHLGASGVENLYGMTEGVLVSSNVVGCANDIISGTDISIGSPLPGSKVRVCAEGNRTPLSVGMVGEVHFSGPSLIKEYIGRADDDKFYIGEDGRQWFCTGDKAVLGNDNRFYLVGRYKDTIIRGGENIEPSAIEAVLGQFSEFHCLEPQIVRVPDHVAGELPVAIVNQEIDQDTARRVRNTILEKMGALYVPVDVISVQSLGINVYPKTLAGKIQKPKLEKLMKTYWEEHRSHARDKLDPFRKSRVTQGLAALINDLTLNPMQRKIWQDTARRVSFSDWVAADGPTKQAQSANEAQPNQDTYHPMNSSDSQNIVEPALGSQVMESLLAAIVEEKGTQINPATRMVDLGVDSILSITILNQIKTETGFSLPSSLFFTQKTIGEIVDSLCSISSPEELLDITASAEEAPRDTCFSTLLQGTPKPGVPSLFLTPPGSGYAFSYDALPNFEDDFAIYSLGSPFLMTKDEASWTVEEAAALYVKTIRNLQAQGPYILGGWSMGAIIAYEIAYQLHQQGEQILGVINLDMPIPKPHPDVLEPTVKLLEILGFYPPIRREGKPDMEIPSYRRQHSLSSVLAKMRYSPRPINTPGNVTPVPIFVIWAGHGDPDRLPVVLAEANELLKRYGSQTQKRTGQEWLQIPRESFGPGDWAEMVGEENVECHVIDHAAHDSMMDPEVVPYVADLMQQAIKGWMEKSMSFGEHSR